MVPRLKCHVASSRRTLARGCVDAIVQMWEDVRTAHEGGRVDSHVGEPAALVPASCRNWSRSDRLVPRPT